MHKFDHMSKSEKNAYFRHVFANNFFMVHFFKTFSTELKSAFFDTHIEFLNERIILALISTFCILWLQMRTKQLKKKQKIFFY